LVRRSCGRIFRLSRRTVWIIGSLAVSAGSTKPLFLETDVRGQILLFSNSSLIIGRVLAVVIMFTTIIAGCREGVDTSKFGGKSTSDVVTLVSVPKPPQLDIILITDQSGSMNGVGGTDPQGLRETAAKYFVNAISKRSNAETPYRIGVVNFGTTASRETSCGLKSLSDPAQLSSLMNCLTVQNLDYTNFLDAFHLADQFLRDGGAYKPGHRPAIVLFTDGDPDDPRHLTREKYFAELRSFGNTNLAPNNCDLYIVGIDKQGVYWPKDGPIWSDLASGNGRMGKAYSIDKMDDLYSRFNSIYRDLLGIPRVAEDVVTGPQDFEVDPYLDQIEFHIFPESNVRLEVRRPNGELVTADPAKGVTVTSTPSYDILTIANPEQGTWKYALSSGTGRIVVFRNPIPIQMKILNPEFVQPQGKPLLLRAAFLRRDGAQVREVPGYQLRLTGRIIPPAQAQAKDVRDTYVEFQRGKNGIFFANKAATDTNYVGSWQVNLEVVGGQKYKAISTQRIDVQPLPYLDMETPAYDAHLPYSDRVDIVCNLKLKGQPINAEDFFANHPNTLILASLVDSPSGPVSGGQFLEQVPSRNGVFAGHLNSPVRVSGDYVVAVRLQGQDKTQGNIFTDTQFAVFSAAPTIWQKLLIYGGETALIIGIVVALIITYIVVRIIWLCVSIFAFLRRSSRAKSAINGLLRISPSGSAPNPYRPFTAPLVNCKSSTVRLPKWHRAPGKLVFVGSTARPGSEIEIGYRTGFFGFTVRRLQRGGAPVRIGARESVHEIHY